MQAKVGARKDTPIMSRWYMLVNTASTSRIASLLFGILLGADGKETLGLSCKARDLLRVNG